MGGLRGEEPIPPPFPQGKWAGRWMVVTSFQANILFEDGRASPPWGRRERGLLDLTQMAVIDRCVGLPLSKWRGHGDESSSGLMTCCVSRAKSYSRQVLAPPL